MAAPVANVENRFADKEFRVGTLKVGANTISAAELAFIDGVTAGTATASKAVVLGASKEIATITSATITTLTATTVNATDVDAGASGAAGTLDVFPTTAAKGKLALAAADSTGDTTTTITNSSQAAARTYKIPDHGAAGWFMLSGAGVVTLSTNAGTLSQLSGRITTEALTTAAAASQALTITNTLCAAADLIQVTWTGGTSTGGTPIIKVVPGAGSFVITIYNKHASAAFDGTFILSFVIGKIT